MTRRTVATAVAFVLLVALMAVAAFLPVPFVAMSPGPTVNVLGARSNAPIIDVRGHKTYPTSGQLRLTTVSVTNPTRQLSLADVMSAWFDKTRAVYPRDAIYPPNQSAQQVEQESTVEMVGSQDNAIAAALTELGYKLSPVTEILAVTKGTPSAGRLKVRDRILQVNGVEIRDAKQVGEALQRSGIGKTATFVVRRGKQTRTVSVVPKASPQDAERAFVGVQLGLGYDFPFDVSVRLGEDIGGPSAGLIFSLGVYDRLTPGSLTGGTRIAGTGTIDQRGRVGPIGGIQQKIVAASEAGAKMFLVPPKNCASAEGADVSKGKIRLVKAPTMHSAVASLKAYAADHSAKLPACG